MLMLNWVTSLTTKPTAAPAPIVSDVPLTMEMWTNAVRRSWFDRMLSKIGL